MRGWIAKTIIVIFLRVCCAKLFNIEIERFGPKEKSIPRSQASNNFTILMKKHETVRIIFCLRLRSAISIINIVYSNDGPEDEIQAFLDGENMGSFISSPYDGAGKGWNLFRSSGRLPGRVWLNSGPHTLVLNVTSADSYGIEVDNMFLDIDDLGMDYPTFFCSLYCFESVNYKPEKFEMVSGGRFVQRSFSSQCAEVDNVNVEIYHETATEFEITANIPKYLSFANYRQPFFDNCLLGSPYWTFQNQSVKHGNRLVETPEARLSFRGTTEATILIVNFDLKNISPVREVDETRIGALLRLKLRNMPRENVLVKPERMGQERHWINMEHKTFTPFSTERTWDIPDFAWSADDVNGVRLTIYPGKQDVVVDIIQLERRSTTDTTIDVYADNDVVIQAVRLGFWHRKQERPESMAVQNTFGNTTELTNIDSFRIYSKVPWSGGYSQVFVLFQDGRTRIQSITPHGLDYIPFGSSLNIGQPLVVNSKRPYSAIRKVNIDPKNLRMSIRYVNGNSADFVLKTSFTNTKLIVEKCSFLQNRNTFPIMTFQSMWVNDGNADVDHVSVDGGEPRHIMSHWQELRGKSAAFFRKCISRHNTQAPDIQIKFLNYIQKTKK